MDPSGVAVVTGASRGIGRAVAIELARSGFDVVATMRDPKAGRDLPADAAAAVGAADSRGSLTVARLDVTEPDTIQLPAGLRVLVNNAAVEMPHLPVEATPIEHWREMFETNVFGLIEVTRRAIPLLRANGGGVICNITSSSLAVAVPLYAVYRASKAAVQALSESLRTEVAGFGIRVIEVMPGPIATDMLAASGQLPEAAEVPGYQTLAQAGFEGRKAVEPYITPVDQAAAAIRDAIVADGGPLRWSCDALGDQLLRAWQNNPDRTLGVV
jgi:NAD(P)-dependent dehydrogenase (short-subunit alcohol dehydrogenase family)